MFEWCTTWTLRTRVLYNDSTKVGHVRNVGRKQWYAEHYATKESKILDTLDEGKTWLEDKAWLLEDKQNGD